MKGLSKESELLFISQSLDLPDTGIAVTREVSLPLNTLERQIFVVTDIQCYVAGTPFTQSSVVPNQDIDWSWSISSQDLNPGLLTTETGNIGNPRVLAAGGARFSIGVTSGDVLQYQWGTNDSTTGTPSDYLGIIATPDYYIRAQFKNAGGIGTASIETRVVGFMAVASADVYAALVTQEVNSQ